LEKYNGLRRVKAQQPSRAATRTQTELPVFCEHAQTTKFGESEVPASFTSRDAYPYERSCSLGGDIASLRVGKDYFPAFTSRRAHPDGWAGCSVGKLGES